MASAATSVLAIGLPTFDKGTVDANTESMIDPNVHAASAATAQRGENRVEFISSDSAGSAHSAFVITCGAQGLLEGMHCATALLMVAERIMRGGRSLNRSVASAVGGRPVATASTERCPPKGNRRAGFL